jgi:hypothetical protein
MRSILLAVLVVLLSTGGAWSRQTAAGERSSRRTWVDSDLGQAVIEGVATPQHLWLRGLSGNIVRFDRRTSERSVVAESVVDILADGPHLWALITLNENESVIRDLRGPDQAGRRVYFDGAPIALFATDVGPGVLTTTKALVPAEEGWSRRLLAGTLQRPAHVSDRRGDALFVGYNMGEWGGGLRRVDLTTGALSFVHQPDGEFCNRRLNPECSPIVGIVSDPGREGCILVGASLAHLSGRYGEVLRVCGDEITQVFQAPLPVVPGSIEFAPGRSWPFDSLVATSTGWIAVGQDRFARSSGGLVRMGDIPPLRPWAGLRVTDQVDDVVFVESACCWGSDDSVRYRVIAVPVTA